MGLVTVSDIYGKYGGGVYSLTQFWDVPSGWTISYQNMVNNYHLSIGSDCIYSPDSTFWTAPIGTEWTIFNLSNENKFILKKETAWLDLNLVGYVEINGVRTRCGGIDSGYSTGYWNKWYFTLAKNDGGPIQIVSMNSRNNSSGDCSFNLWTNASGEATLVAQMLNGAIAPTYTWRSWPQLSGNAGMFLMDLSKINDSIIGDGSTIYETFDSSLFDLNSLTDLYTMTVNLLNSQETTIAYCGDNYLTATKRTTLVNNVTTVYVTLKFYFRSDVPVYTTPELTVYSSDGAVSRDYLSIMYDETEEVAAPNIIQLWTATGKYGINEYSLPSDEQMRALYIWLQDNGAERETVSPYDIGTTDTGGDPNTPTPQDHITDSNLPTLSGLNLGVVTLYLPTTEQLQAIAAFLWSDNVLDNFKKYFNNFADNLLNLFVLPYHPSGLLTRTFKVGNMVSEITDVEYTTQRFYDVDMGSINIEKLWDSYLDFSPYTKIEIFLPYLGLHSLDIDEIMCPAKMDGTLQRGLGSVLSVVYRIDVLTGVIVAKIKINGEIRYQFEGRVGANIPLTGQTYASMVQGIITAGAGLISTVATGGLTAPLSAAAAVSGTINASKPTVERIGNISGDASMLATDVPYVVITRPNKPMLEEQEKYTGFPSYKSGTLNNFSGLTICEDVHVEGISCTEEERNAIVDWLKNGVIL